MDKQALDPYVSWFRSSSPYINAHRGRTFVILLEGGAFLEPEFNDIISDLALLNALGVRLVIVFGARPQVEAAFVRAGIDIQRINAQGPTWIADANMMQCIHQCVGAMRIELEGRFSLGLPNSPMHGAALKVISGNLVMAKPLGVREGIDFQYSGEVRRVETQAISAYLDQGAMVILPPLGYSATGEVFDLNAEEIATAAAIGLQADKLICLGPQKGLVNSQGQLVRELAPAQAEHWLQEDPAHQVDASLQRQIQAACHACRQGVARTHLLDYRTQGALLKELFTRDGVGTLITDQGYEQLRNACIQDVAGLLALIQPFEEKGILVRRSRERLESEIEHFSVIERDGMIIGCAALYTFAESAYAELACIVVDTRYRGRIRGDRLLAHTEKRARAAGVRHLFALTTHTAHWFLEHGFILGQLQDLPPTRQELYNWQRNSKILIKTL
ncbi:amino-acid N-acetyltransferase [Allopseudospirillum japonicum]|uniref:Amino-acid acetyltransferase n=1 Tax=Allopseudospirillum japonicum TaxID=64971 RepID=A0A1H6TI85_9GAMM|nr:amino-acid N-acetyltransferase [Allopseudospirillum japonicum]SEI79721.1 amino-acid N-acetyltransferase [Allopseudospirillum japonicum]